MNHLGFIDFLTIAVGVYMVAYFLMEGFESVVLPRAVTHPWRLTSWFYRMLWARVWRPIAAKIDDFRKRDTFLGYFGPISLLLLLQVWAIGLMTGFAIIQYGLRTNLYADGEPTSFASDLYFSGTTFFTVGFGDLAAIGRAGRFVAVMEAGTGFGFLAIVIGYLPVIYGAFSRREASITLLDGRAGSPPTATEMIRRHAINGSLDDLQTIIADLEKWTSELMESHLSYPVLCYYRSQHDDQSWVSALTVAMDTAAIVMVGVSGISKWRAKLMFAMGRHAMVDLSIVFDNPPAKDYLSRMSDADFHRVGKLLAEIGHPFDDPENAREKLERLRDMYEPYCVSLARRFDFSLPSFISGSNDTGGGQLSAWDRVEHF